MFLATNVIIIEWIVQLIYRHDNFLYLLVKFKNEKFVKERKVHILRVYCAMYTVKLRGSHTQSKVLTLMLKLYNI